MAVVYGLRNRYNNKVYIGCTSGRKTAKRKYNRSVESLLAKRFREHRCLLNANKHSEPKLQKDWNTHAEWFTIEVLEELADYPPVSEKRAAELKWMKAAEEHGILYNTYKGSFSFTKEATKAGIEASRTAGRWHKGVPKDHGAKISEGKKRARMLRQLNKIV